MPWSDWQDPWDAPFNGPNVAEAQYVAREITRDDGAPFDVAAWLPGARSDIMAGSGTSVDGAIPGGVITEYMRVLADYGIVTLRLGYAAAKYDAADVSGATPIEEPPTVPGDAGTPPDSEYDDPTYGPYIVGRIGYEGPPQGDFVQWGGLLDASPYLQTYREFQIDNGFGDLTHPFDSSRTPQVTFSWLDTLGTDDWLAYPAGTVLDVTDTPVSASVGSIGTHTAVPAIDVNGLTSPALWLIAQPDWLDSAVDLPYGLITHGPVSSGQNWASQFFNGGVLRGGGPGPFYSLGPNIVCTTTRWRYWIDGWHTIGGHFATKGGATLRINTPGKGWVDVEDGFGS